MSSNSTTVNNTRRFDDIIQAIEKRTVAIGGKKGRLVVLSIHPSFASDDSQHEVSLRLALRPEHLGEFSDKPDSIGSRKQDKKYVEPGATLESSFEARLSELGLSYSFRLNNDVEKEADALVKRIKEDVPRALTESTTPKIVFIDPVSPAVKILAAVVSLLVPFLVILYWTSLKRATLAILLFVAASTIYKLITARFRLK